MLQVIEHPSHYISSELKDSIRDYSFDAEKLGELHPNQLQLVFEQNWFKLLFQSNMAV